MRKTFLIVLLAVSTLVVLNVWASAADLTPMEELGKKLFFDENLSVNRKMSCAACHAPETGFTGPDSAINAAGAVYPATIGQRFGNRKPPTAAYGGDSPVLYYDQVEAVWIGGMFWDGRATGWTLGDPLAEQAQGPFLNPLEQAMPNAKFVCQRVRQSAYAGLFKEVWGDPIPWIASRTSPGRMNASRAPSQPMKNLAKLIPSAPSMTFT